MSTPADAPDVYHLLFEQLNPVIRWALTILTLGLFGLAAWAWKRQEKSIQRIEQQMHGRMDREMAEFRQELQSQRRDTNQRLDEMNRLLVQIVNNTGHREER